MTQQYRASVDIGGAVNDAALGKPVERKREQVEEDTKAGLISKEQAKTEYNF